MSTKDYVETFFKSIGVALLSDKQKVALRKYSPGTASTSRGQFQQYVGILRIDGFADQLVIEIHIEADEDNLAFSNSGIHLATVRFVSELTDGSFSYARNKILSRKTSVTSIKSTVTEIVNDAGKIYGIAKSLILTEATIEKAMRTSKNTN